MDGLWLDDAPTESFATRGGQTRIVLLPTETPCDFFLFVVIKLILIFLTGKLLIIAAGALALARLWEFHPGAIFHCFFDGL